MVVEHDALSFAEWFPDALASYWAITLWAAGAMLVISWLVSALRHGPVAALNSIGRVLGNGAGDLVRISPRRVAALTWLAVKESIRHRVVVVFGVLILLLLFAGWFLDPGSNEPARLYLSFVLTATSYLVLSMALFLSALSLPADIKNKTLHTVVTKPVRLGEIVLGRMLGFTVVGTLLMLIMGTISYMFVVRGLAHRHELEPDELARAEKTLSQRLASGQRTGVLEIETTRVHNHRHKIRLDPFVRTPGKPGAKPKLKQAGSLRTDTEQGHLHEVSYQISSPQGGKRKKVKIAGELGSSRGGLVARVPLYGKLRFKNRAGQNVKEGVNVGDEWTYRGFIEGGTLATAIWAFEGIHESNFPEERFPRGLPLEMTIEVFRTYKGKTDDPRDIPGIPGSLWVRNPETGEKIQARIFTARDFAIETQYIPRQLIGPDGKRLDLFKDFAPDGKLEVWLRCEQPAQYFGAAQADLYFRADDASFALNFAKGYLGIWLQMVLLIGFGVMFSTFLSSAVALLATAGALVGGFFSRFMAELGAGEVVGGGPTESFIRLITQQNVVSPMEPGLRTDVAKMLDTVLEKALSAAAAVLPEFGSFSFSDYVAYGFDISAGVMLKCSFQVAGFLVPLFVAGYFFLKTREMAR